MSADRENETDNEEEGENRSTDSGKGLTFEEWNRMATEANPLDRRLKREREFKQTEPPVEAIKFYREGRTYYQLNRGDKAIRRLRYQDASRDVNTKKAKAFKLIELTNIPGRSYVEIGQMDLENETRMRVTLGEVEWKDGETFDGTRSLTLYQPSLSGVLPLDRLDLTPVEIEPSVIDSKTS